MHADQPTTDNITSQEDYRKLISHTKTLPPSSERYKALKKRFRIFTTGIYQCIVFPYKLLKVNQHTLLGHSLQIFFPDMNIT